MFPFHTWLPDAHVEAPTAGSVILAGVLLKMGTYGFIRFSLPMFPDAVQDTSSLNFSYLTFGLFDREFGLLHLMIFLSIVGIIYGALVAMMQRDAKKLVAYSSVSHLGFCMLGLFALNPNGINGSILQQINHGISTGALFLIVGIVYERRHTREISEYGGLSHVMPGYAIIFLIITMASIGLPLLNGFIGEFTILAGAFQRHWSWGAWGCAGIVLGAALHALALSADDVRAGDQSKKPGFEGSQLTRVCDVTAFGHHVLLDWNLPQALLQVYRKARSANRPEGTTRFLRSRRSRFGKPAQAAGEAALKVGRERGRFSLTPPAGIPSLGMKVQPHLRVGRACRWSPRPLISS